MEERVPEIRFKGFEGPWNKNNASDIGIYSKGRGYSKNDLAKEGTPIILYGRLYTNYQFSINEVDTYAVPKENSVYSFGNEVIIPASGETAEDIARAAAVEQQGVLLGGDLNIIRTYSSFNPAFIALNISTGGNQKELASKAQGKSVVHIHNSDVQELVFFIPTLQEQTYITDMFQNLDTLITLTQQKLDQLKTLKKACLEKMFPKEGETVPEIRFKGFKGPWEKRKLSDLATMHARIGWQNLRTSEFLDRGDYMLVTGTDFDNGKINYSTCHYVEQERYEQDRNIQIKNGNILITKDGTLGKVAFVQDLSMPATLNAGVFNVEIKDETLVSNKYLFQYLKAPFLLEYVEKKATGGTIKHLNQNLLVDFPILVPTKEEQESIGTYFNGLDNLITLKQQKLDRLKSLKQACLEKMFV